MTRSLLALLLACSAPAQIIGQAFGPQAGATMLTFGQASVGAGAFLNTHCFLPNTLQAWAAYSFAAAAPPAPFPLDPRAGGLLIDAAPGAFIGVEAMAFCCVLTIESAHVLSVPAQASLIGLTVYSQCFALDTSGAWAVTHGWEVLLLP